MKILGLKIPPAEIQNSLMSINPGHQRGTISDSPKAQGAAESQAPGPGENSQTEVVYHVILSD